MLLVISLYNKSKMTPTHKCHTNLGGNFWNHSTRTALFFGHSV